MGISQGQQGDPSEILFHVWFFGLFFFFKYQVSNYTRKVRTVSLCSQAETSGLKDQQPFMFMVMQWGGNGSSFPHTGLASVLTGRRESGEGYLSVPPLSWCIGEDNWSLGVLSGSSLSSRGLLLPSKRARTPTQQLTAERGKGTQISHCLDLGGPRKSIPGILLSQSLSFVFFSSGRDRTPGLLHATQIIYTST